MSRGFVKEEDQEEIPIIPPRAALPEGLINYVTPLGMNQLMEEKDELERQRSEIKTDDDQQRRRDTAVIEGQLALLKDRIATARVLQPEDQHQDEVRFGATVAFKMNGLPNTFQIVGVDEADIKAKKISFVSPIAKALTGAKKGSTIPFNLGNETSTIEVLDIRY